MLFTLFATSAAAAQLRPRQYDIPTVIAGNAVIGGISAAIQAAVTGKPLAKAFLGGVLGGALHGSGKVISTDVPVAGLALGATGTSIAANAGRGIGFVDELVLPIGPGRLRLMPGIRRVDITVNAFESVTLARRLSRPGTRIDWSQSLQAGTAVLRTSNTLYSGSGLVAAGITSGSIILLSDRASHPDETLRHERIHAQQGWFFQELWGRPLELSLRQRVRETRLLPDWLELGIVMPGMLELERQTLGPTGPFRSWRETEAESLEDRGKR